MKTVERIIIKNTNNGIYYLLVKYKGNEYFDYIYSIGKMIFTDNNIFEIITYLSFDNIKIYSNNNKQIKKFIDSNNILSIKELYKHAYKLGINKEYIELFLNKKEIDMSF